MNWRCFYYCHHLDWLQTRSLSAATFDIIGIQWSNIHVERADLSLSSQSYLGIQRTTAVAVAQKWIGFVIANTIATACPD